MASSSNEDFQKQFEILSSKFDDLMTLDSSKDGLLPILEEMLAIIKDERNILHMKSILSTLLPNLHKALSHFERYRVIFSDSDPRLGVIESHHMTLYFKPAKGVSSLQMSSGDHNTVVTDPVDTFHEFEDLLWFESDDEEDGQQKIAFFIDGIEQDIRFSVYQCLLYHFWKKKQNFDLRKELLKHKAEITYKRICGPAFVEDFADLEKETRVILHFLNRIYNLGIGFNEGFINTGLDKKITEQMEDHFVTSPLHMPPWWIHLMITYPFLFGYKTRVKFFKLVSYHQNSSSLENLADDDDELQAEECLVRRDDILECAKQIMDRYAGENNKLSVQFAGEEGTGKGPTAEFYTLVCKALERSNCMWREARSFGLFPCPMSASSTEEVKANFLLLGQLVGKAIQNNMLLDFYFSKALYKLILGKELSIDDIESFEPNLRKMLTESGIEDLSLSFVIPGYEDFTSHLQKNVSVDSTNLQEYVDFVIDGTVGSGIKVQMESFKVGLKQVYIGELYPTTTQIFSIFSGAEFEAVLCGQTERSWSFEELTDHIIIGDGYTPDSTTIVNLFEVLRQLKLDERRGFLTFVTSRPRLPHGGFASLEPKLKVTQMTANQERLPCASTCDNTLFLPPYVSKERMERKLLYAISEGQEYFAHM